MQWLQETITILAHNLSFICENKYFETLFCEINLFVQNKYCHGILKEYWPFYHKFIYKYCIKCNFLNKKYVLEYTFVKLTTIFVLMNIDMKNMPYSTNVDVRDYKW